ncbi:MAG: efflux RND transporter periplasmic adaptor subunit [Cytophagales bacterium]|nr:efflux RND transporter periplasmic adaptor subunit [Cytophagales bacterium]
MKKSIICKTTGSLSLIAVPLIAGWLSGCSSDEKTANQTTGDGSKIQNVEVTHPGYRSFVAEILITGTAEPNREVFLHAMESGYVKAVYKDIGDAVQKGEVIAELNNPELYRQRQQLQAEVESKQSVYERLQSIYEKTPSITPLQVLEDAKAEYLSMKAKLDAANDRISFLRVKAPFSGIITQRFVDEGAMVQSGLTEDNPQKIVEIQEISPIRLSIPLPGADAGAIGKGMDVVVTFPELPGESFTAKVSRTANSLDRKSKTMRVEIDIPNADGEIKPGMYAKVLLQINSRDSVLSLPVTAQVIFQNQPFVMVVVDGKVERVPLRKGLSNKDYFEVLNLEVSPHAQVIVQGKGLVKPGQHVKPVNKTE